MKYLFICLAILMSSCSEEVNHDHDGIYKATVVNPLNFLDAHYEVLKIEGNKITDAKYSISGAFAGETIYACQQFADKIEFNESSSITKVLKFKAADSSLRLNEMVVFKYLGSQGEITITKKASAPLIKKNQDGTISLLPENKIVKPAIKVLRNEQETQIGYFLEDKEINPETLLLYANKNIYSIRTVKNDEEEEIEQGTFRKDGRLIRVNGEESFFKKRNGCLYRLNGASWIKYVDQSCGM